MERFLRFIAANPQLPCDFISLHRKGTVGDDPPDPRRLEEASAATARQALAIDARRFGGLTIWNNEADEKVGFEVPYAPRIDERGAAWLAAVTVIHDQLGERYREANLRFAAAADNANLQLVRSPFDGRRSIMTRVGTADTDLLKVPAYGFYELLRLLGDRHGDVVSGAARLFPHTDLYHLVTVADTHVASLLTYYPDPETAAAPSAHDRIRHRRPPLAAGQHRSVSDRSAPFQCLHGGRRLGVQPVSHSGCRADSDDSAASGDSPGAADRARRGRAGWDVR